MNVVSHEVDLNACKQSSGVYFFGILAQTIVNAEDGIVGQPFVSGKMLLLVK